MSATQPNPASSHSGAALLCLIAAAFWGLWWLPIWSLETAGVEGGYAGLVMHIGAIPGLLVVFYWRRGPLIWKTTLGAVLAGLAITLFATALATTDVVRAILLFYLAPIWGTLIECTCLGRRWSKMSIIAIVISLIGILVIFRFDISLTGWQSGDFMALLSGIIWAIATALIFSQDVKREGSIVLIAGLAAILFSFILAPLTAPLPAWQAINETLHISILSGSLYLIPIIAVTLWGATHLPPATISFLMTAEIITGVASSAWFLDQPFGIPEIAGAVMIASGALVEVVKK